MTIVIPHPATEITASDYESFDQCAERILKATRRRLRYRDRENPDNLDGLPIEIDPKLHQVFLMLSLTRPGTEEEFEKLFGAIMAVVKQMEDAEELPEGWVKSVATPFNTKCPRIPERFADDIAGAVIKAYLTGSAEITLVRELPPVEEPPIEEETE
jgi:hypothetical protein